MAEGTDLTVLGEPDSNVTEEGVRTDKLATMECEERVVRPKEKKLQPADPLEDVGAVADKGVSRTAVGNWWQSPALSSQGDERAKTPPPIPEPMFQGWRESQWMEEEEQDWAYTSDPGTASMESLRERFGEASFRDAPSWQPWAVGLDPSTWRERGSSGADTRFRLASPKLRKEQVSAKESAKQPNKRVKLSKI